MYILPRRHLWAGGVPEPQAWKAPTLRWHGIEWHFHPLTEVGHQVSIFLIPNSHRFLSRFAPPTSTVYLLICSQLPDILMLGFF